MLGLWREEVNLDDLADEARWFLEGVMRGEPEELAAQRATVTLDEVRRWSSDRRFRLALKRARRGIGCVRAIFPDTAPEEGLPRDATVAIDSDGNLTAVSNTVPDEQLVGTPGPASTLGLDLVEWQEFDARIRWGERADEVLAEIQGRRATATPPPVGLFSFAREADW